MPSPHRFALFLILSVVSVLPSLAQSPGTLDTTFGIAGVAITTPPLSTDPVLTSGAKDMVIQRDGKIVMLVNAGDDPQTFRNALVRFNADGTLDSGFANGGFAYIAWTAPDPGIAVSLTLQVINGQEHFLVVGGDRCERYTPTGALDTTFGTGGVVILNGGGGANAVAVQVDQKILLAGGGAPITRLNANGTPDASYGPGGLSRTKSGVTIRTLYITNDGKVLAAGDIVGAKVKGVSYRDFAIARLNSNGTMDSTFGSNGKTVIDFAGRSDIGNDIAVDAVGRILLAGQVDRTGAGTTGISGGLARFKPNGQIDTTFGTDGKITLSFGDVPTYFNSVSVQADGKILAVGVGRIPGNAADVLTARYISNGTLDTSFDSDGWVLKDFYGNYDTGIRGLLWIDAACSCEKLVVGGAAYVQDGTISSKSDIVALRYIL